MRHTSRRHGYRSRSQLLDNSRLETPGAIPLIVALGFRRHKLDLIQIIEITLLTRMSD